MHPVKTLHVAAIQDKEESSLLAEIHQEAIVDLLLLHYRPLHSHSLDDIWSAWRTTWHTWTTCWTDLLIHLPSSTYRTCSMLDMRQLLEDWLNKSTFAIATWRGVAQRYWLEQVVETARARRGQWLQKSPPDQLGRHAQIRS